MVNTIIFSNGAEVEHVRAFKLVLNDKVAIDLRGVYGAVKWGAEDNDEVLSINDNSGPSAIVTATALGKSTMVVKSRGDEMRIAVEVVAAQRTESVSMAFGNVRDTPAD